MGLSDIRVMLEFRSQPSAECHGVSELLDYHIDLIRVRMAGPQSLQQQLIKQRHQCPDPILIGECGILQNSNGAALNNDYVCHDATH